MQPHLVMAEFGPRVRSRLFSKKPSLKKRLNPTFESFFQYFPQAQLTLYTDQAYLQEQATETITVRYIAHTPFKKEHPRYYWHCNDYYKVLALKECCSPIALSLDADMRIVSSEFQQIVDYAKLFGICLPANPRFQVKVDGIIGADADYTKQEDPSEGNGLAVNMSPIAVATQDPRAQRVLNAYLEEMETRPVRGPLAMWRAIWKSGENPCYLPYQWCVCLENIACGEEHCLHEGHKKVKEYYNGKV